MKALSLICCLFISISASARYSIATFSSAVISTNSLFSANIPEPALKEPSFKATQLIAPAVLIGSGTLVHCFAHDNLDIWFKNKAQSLRGPYIKADDYLQYLPLFMDLTLAFACVPAEKGLLDRSIELGVAAISVTAITRLGKALIHSQRPNNSDFKSFPSGHTSTAFVGAELVRIEYGPWWGAGAYLVATGIGFMRMYNNRHWFSDVLAGAGVGILSAHIGEWLLEPTKRLFHIPDSDWGNGRKIAPTIAIEPYSGTPCVGLALVF